MEKLDIGFIGLGAMGARSAHCLIKAGHVVHGFDLSADALNRLSSEGGVVAESPGAAAAKSMATVLFLVNAKQAEAVLFGDEGIASQAGQGHIVLSCVTMGASDARGLAERCQEHDMVFIDAPVSGGTVGAESGSLSIMASGPAEAMVQCTPILNVMGGHVLNVGAEAGQGSTFKTINQMLCGVHLAVAGEAMALAAKAGLDTQQVFDLVTQSAASSWMLNNRGPAMIKRHYQPVNSAVDIFVKDLGVVQDLARELKFPATVSSAALQSFLGASGVGLGQSDDAAVTEFYRLVSDTAKADS